MRKPLLEMSAIVVGYAMSRLDRQYLTSRRFRSWKAAFAEAGDSLKVRPASVKNLRDEFDPVHGNVRRGWKGRPMRPNRLRAMGDLCELSDDALLHLVDRVLAGDVDAIDGVIKPLTEPRRGAANVAERLHTGALAESHFMENCAEIVEIEPGDLIDRRMLACGFDFGIRRRDRIAIEVKGIKDPRGGITFTDHEWSEAKLRRTDYWLVVVGNLKSKPIARLIADPSTVLDAKCRHHSTITASWQATVAVA